MQHPQLVPKLPQVSTRTTEPVQEGSAVGHYHRGPPLLRPVTEPVNSPAHCHSLRSIGAVVAATKATNSSCPDPDDGVLAVSATPAITKDFTISSTAKTFTHSKPSITAHSSKTPEPPLGYFHAQTGFLASFLQHLISTLLSRIQVCVKWIQETSADSEISQCPFIQFT